MFYQVLHMHFLSACVCVACRGNLEVLVQPGKPVGVWGEQAAVGLMVRSLMGVATFVGLNIMIASRGPVAYAASEIAKQAWIMSSQAFNALDVAAQALVAGHLGGVSCSGSSHDECPVVTERIGRGWVDSDSA
jgi:hypothetical protein